MLSLSAFKEFPDVVELGDDADTEDDTDDNDEGGDGVDGIGHGELSRRLPPPPQVAVAPDREG